MKHTHWWIDIKTVTRYKTGPHVIRTELDGIRTVCVECGEARNVWETGVIEKIANAGSAQN